eukprot:6180689-Pleurochrysis_carterae.AAC.5
MSSRKVQVKGECGRKSQVDRNLRATSTTSEAGEGGNAMFALAAAQRICRSVQADAAVWAPRLLMIFFIYYLFNILEMNSCSGAYASRNLSTIVGNLEMATGRGQSEITASLPETRTSPLPRGGVR